jgi:hypothetical protein
VSAARRAPWWIAATLLALLLPDVPAAGVSFELSDRNSVVWITPDAGDFFEPPGVFEWTVDGVNHVWEMLWYVGVDGGPRDLINSFDLVSTNVQDLNGQAGDDTITANYAYSDLFDPNVVLNATQVVQLTGGAAGSASSSLAQSLTLQNAGAVPVTLQLFAYADLDVGADTFNNVTQIAGNTAEQTGQGYRVTEAVSLGANHWMAAPSPDVSNLIAFSSDNLDGSTGPFTDDGSYAFQWNRTLAPSESVTLNRVANATLDVPDPPPPAARGLVAAGPIDPVSGFPIWFQDSNGVAVQLLPFQDPATGVPEPYSISAPPDPNNPYSMAIGFDEEAFWWSADAQLDLPGGASARLVLAQEAAFMGDESAVFGNNFAFGRIRIRIDDPEVGTYTVTHPYGVNVFEVTEAGERIVYTNDNGDLYPYLNNDRILDGPVGPFLIATTGVPLGYVGDPGVDSTVTGSPSGNNFFRVEGPGGIAAQTNLFAVSGKLYTGPTVEVLAGGNLLLQSGTLAVSTIGGAGDTTLTQTGGRLAADFITADLIQEGGVLAPGHSPGTTEILGNYLLGSEAFLEIEIEGLAGNGVAGGHDFVHVYQDTVLEGELTLLMLAPLGTADVGQSFDILRYDNSLEGEFAGLPDGSLFSVSNAFGPDYQFRLDYGSGYNGFVTLTLTSTPEPTSILLLATGALGVLLLRWNRHPTTRKERNHEPATARH